MNKNHIRKFVFTSIFLTICAAMNAQAVKDFYFETRVAFESQVSNDDNTGFKGQWLNMRLDGEIAKGLTYSYRQRFTKLAGVRFFDATDWIHLDWAATENLTLSGGKQVVAIGGYEYDRAPIDLYYCSEFWNNIPCYAMGVSASYKLSQQDVLLLQLCNSPFRAWAGENTYALNLMWYGNHGVWETMWSANAMQNADNTVAQYFSLGNRFNFTDGIHLDVDLMNRTTFQEYALFESWSLVTELSAKLGEGSRAFAKYSHDFNSGNFHDMMVFDGTSMNMASIGAEFNLLKENRDALRFFCVGAYDFGTQGNPNGAKVDGQCWLQAGLKWKMRIK